METKTCSKCGCTKPLIDFRKYNVCKQCKKEYQSEWYAEHPTYFTKWSAEHREQHRASNAKWMAKWRKEHPEQCRASKAKWWKENPEYTIKWRAEHPEYFRKYSRKYCQTPQGKLVRKNANHNRRAKIKGQKVTLEEWETIKQQHGHRCYWCRRKFKDEELTMDHVIALKRGGTHEASNIVAACGSCNSSKKDRNWSLV